MELEDVLHTPVVTEKSVLMQEKNNQYTFAVDTDANKVEVRRAVQEQFDVNVTKVRTMNVRGKQRRVRGSEGYTSDWKKAIVTLAEGDHIEVVEGLVG